MGEDAEGEGERSSRLGTAFTITLKLENTATFCDSAPGPAHRSPPVLTPAILEQELFWTKYAETKLLQLSYSENQHIFPEWLR